MSASSGQDTRDVPFTITTKQGVDHIQILLDDKLAVRRKLREELSVIDGEIEGLRSAQAVIAKLADVRRR